MRILRKKMEDEDLRPTPQALEVAKEMLERSRLRASFSNAGEVINLLDIAKMNFQARVQRETDPAKRFENKLLPEDFDPDYERRLDAADDCRRRLGGRVGGAILAKFLDWIRKADVARGARIPLPQLVPTRFVIRGPPDTGKNTAARAVGRVFYDAGFLGTPETVEKSVSDLLGQYVGHTAPRTRAVLEAGLGKALFVRDAARLAERSSYAAEAVGELDSLLSSPKYRDRLVVVFTGTAAEMDGLLAARPTLARLFRDDVVSQPLAPDESLVLLRRTLRAKGVEVAAAEAGEWEIRAKKLWSKLAMSPMWQNAKTVQELAHKLAEPLLESWQERMILEANEARAKNESAAAGSSLENDEEEAAPVQPKDEEEDPSAVGELDRPEEAPPQGKRRREEEESGRRYGGPPRQHGADGRDVSKRRSAVDPRDRNARPGPAPRRRGVGPEGPHAESSAKSTKTKFPAAGATARPPAAAAWAAAEVAFARPGLGVGGPIVGCPAYRPARAGRKRGGVPRRAAAGRRKQGQTRGRKCHRETIQGERGGAGSQGHRGAVPVPQRLRLVPQRGQMGVRGGRAQDDGSGN